MPDSEKDRLGEKLEDAGAAREDQWAHKRDQELLAKMRVKGRAELLCPKCKKALVAKNEHNVPMYVCPENHGAWLDAITLKNLVNPK
jgi:hypothetical protein